MIQSLAALLSVLALAGAQDPVQEPRPAPTPLDDVEVTARANVDRAQAFVRRVAAPARGRGLGRWKRICPGIANLDRSAAQPIVDRIADRAAEVGIDIQEPGCEINIIVVFSDDPGGLTRALVRAEPRVFRHGGNGIDRGTAALRDFEASEQPVRWWTLSMPIDSETGRRAVRVPGDSSKGSIDVELARLLGCDNPGDCVIASAPLIRSAGGASHLNSQIVDQIYRSIIIVDIEAVAGVNAAQMGDYLAMIALTQVNPEADTGAFDTVLNLFDDPQGTPGMSEWDRSYLSALYSSPSRRRSAGAQADAVAAIMNRTPTTEPGQ